MNNKELELEAEKYGYKQYGNSCGAKQERQNCIEDFVTGATSDAAKQYWYKQFEKQKLEFAIEQLKKASMLIVSQHERKANLRIIIELEEKLSKI